MSMPAPSSASASGSPGPGDDRPHRRVAVEPGAQRRVGDQRGVEPGVKQQPPAVALHQHPWHRHPQLLVGAVPDEDALLQVDQAKRHWHHTPHSGHARQHTVGRRSGLGGGAASLRTAMSSWVEEVSYQRAHDLGARVSPRVGRAGAGGDLLPRVTATGRCPGRAPGRAARPARRYSSTAARRADATWWSAVAGRRRRRSAGPDGWEQGPLVPRRRQHRREVARRGDREFAGSRGVHPVQHGGHGVRLEVLDLPVQHPQRGPPDPRSAAHRRAARCASGP